MQVVSFPSVQDFSSALQRFAEERKWHLKYAKFNWRAHQSLLAHCLSVSSLSSSLLDYLGELQCVKVTDKLRMQMFLTGFLHDAGKESESFQSAVEDFLAGKDIEPLDFGHQQEKDLCPIIGSLQKDIESRFPAFKDFQGIWEEVVWSISQLGRREDAGAVSHSFKRVPSNDAMTCKEIVHLADIMMSKLTVEDAASTPVYGQIVSKLRFVYSRVSTVRGVLTQFLHAALEDQFTKNGYKPVQWFSNGTVYVGKADAPLLVADEKAMVDSIEKKMRDVLDRIAPSQVARASFGNLRAQVIAVPEFLFANNEVIHEFWQFIAQQRFARPNIRELNDLRDVERKLLEILSNNLKGKDESSRLALLARFSADFNLLIILYSERKQLIDRADYSKIDRRKIEEDTAKKIQESFAQVLDLPVTSMMAWPEVANQTKTERRFPVAKTLWQSPYYENYEVWRSKFIQALEEATTQLAIMWSEFVPDKYAAIARLLVADVTSPLNPKAILSEVKNLNSIISNGKTGHGTTTCQKCGAEAVFEAQAELFGKSEIYHDSLVAGKPVGGGNKIRVCELCDFEEKLRSIFVEKGESFFILPQLALSRSQQEVWQSTVDNIKYNPGEFPPLLRVNQWAKRVMEGNIPALSAPGEAKIGSTFSENELADAIQKVADTNVRGDDLSPMIEPPLDAKDGKTVASLIRQGKCELNEEFKRDVLAILNRVEPVYLSPNFIMLFTSGTVADREEPESSTAIKWTFFRCILARLFSATVISGGSSIAEERITLGYTTVPSNAILTTLAERLNSRRGWIPIPELERATKKLSALFLIVRELSSADADYGNSTLLRLLDEEPGRILVRMTSNRKRQVSPKRLIGLLDTWNSEVQLLEGDIKSA